MIECRKKKVLIVASVISFIEWFNKGNVDYLRNELGCEVHIACNINYMDDTDEERTEKYINNLKHNGVVIHNIEFVRSPLSKKNIKAYRMLKHIIMSEKFELIHCHTPVASILTRIAAQNARKHGSVVMYTCHGFHFHKSSPKKNWIIFYPIERLCAHLCDYIVTINREDYKCAKCFGTKEVRYIPGVGVDISHIKHIKIDRCLYRKKIGVPDDAIMIISIGEIIERKNHEVIIRALGKIKSPNIYYVICGKGPLKENLEKLSKKLGIVDKVIFLGFRNDIPELCYASDFSAFPSKIEGLGLAGIEAMAAGLPLVSSNIHGISDYVVNGVNGYTCSPDDVDGFVNAINKLANDNELRKKMRSNCIKSVEPYELKNALRVMWDIYDEILK